MVDSLQQQIILLNRKVDALYQMVEQLTRQLTPLIHRYGVVSPPHRRSVEVESLPHPSLLNPLFQGMREGEEGEIMTHKDVLSDTEGWEIPPDYNISDQDVSPELQIRRLTAQVTAAYHRIAVLEEQLLAHRMH